MLIDIIVVVVFVEARARVYALCAHVLYVYSQRGFAILPGEFTHTRECGMCLCVCV